MVLVESKLVNTTLKRVQFSSISQKFKKMKKKAFQPLQYDTDIDGYFHVIFDC